MLECIAFVTKLCCFLRVTYLLLAEKFMICMYHMTCGIKQMQFHDFLLKMTTYLVDKKE